MPHLIPYQGSKRLLAPAILDVLRVARAGRPVRRLYEPFAGSAALTLAAASVGLAESYVIADTYAPLTRLWQVAIEQPEQLADGYAALWHAGDFNAVRARFHAEQAPAQLLYLLTRCVKSAVRFNRQGLFNQAADRRRRGTRPERVRDEALQVAALLAGRAEVRTGDALLTTADAGADDVAYLDPPWHGTSVGRDTRYHAGYGKDALEALIAALHARGVLVLLSYDGKRGGRDFGQVLPSSLLRHDLPAQRSSQATLLGRAEWTTESLYVSRPG